MPASDVEDDWEILSNRHKVDGPALEGEQGLLTNRDKNKITGKSKNRHTYFERHGKNFPSDFKPGNVVQNRSHSIKVNYPQDRKNTITKAPDMSDSFHVE